MAEKLEMKIIKAPTLDEMRKMINLLMGTPSEKKFDNDNPVNVADLTVACLRGAIQSTIRVRFSTFGINIQGSENQVISISFSGKILFSNEQMIIRRDFFYLKTIKNYIVEGHINYPSEKCKDKRSYPEGIFGLGTSDSKVPSGHLTISEDSQ